MAMRVFRQPDVRLKNSIAEVWLALDAFSAQLMRYDQDRIG